MPSIIFSNQGSGGGGGSSAVTGSANFGLTTGYVVVGDSAGGMGQDPNIRWRAGNYFELTGSIRASVVGNARWQFESETGQPGLYLRRAGVDSFTIRAATAFNVFEGANDRGMQFNVAGGGLHSFNTGYGENFTMDNQGRNVTSGSLIFRRRITTGSIYNATVDDHTVFVSGSGGEAAIVRPPPTPFDGREFWVKDVTGNAATGNITITGSVGGGAFWIDNGTTPYATELVLSTAGAKAMLVYHAPGKTWVRMV